MELVQIVAMTLGVAACAVVLAFLVWAFVDVYRNRELDETSRLIWLLFLFFAPFVGAAAWCFAKPRGIVTLREARLLLDGRR